MNYLITIILLVLLISCNTETRNPKKIDPPQNIENETVNNPQLSPMMGWASWNNYRVNINEEVIKAQADAMISTGLVKAGYSFINIDDGFFGGRDSTGRILSHKERFPKGMESLSDYIHSKGLKAGIYSDAGINTCASYWDKDTIGAGMGLYGHDRKDLTLFLNEWNYDFIKIDWCGGEWLGLDEELRYTEVGKMIKAIKPSAKYNVCRWKFPGKWVTQIADSWRISGDIGNNFESILKIIDLNADLWMYCSKGHYNDMDMLQVGRGMSYEEDKTHFTMWCMMHSPLLLGNDLTNMSKETMDIISNEEIISLNQSSFVYQARRLIDYGDLEVWAKPLISTMSGEVAVAMLNRSDNTDTITFSLKSVGLDASKSYTMTDLWSKETFQHSTEREISRLVVPHGVVVLKIKGEALPFNVFQYKDQE
ncbi:glycoside hydrolase family 27 protein [Muricauda sp. CAU 1633]|uniref:glycoside hydrolase family 27 protein n=1 Tax=Allomuricauda sp. CAU 1633 TaxID=2816036 RepID=UPI001A8E4D75|nr:glycoside hydrolase family 27 protein [Muricauda sp. CAU 1633]MBO0321976.1 glycoside hydrolase family 27 protein [Muricauda sp. CAU 1633]